MIVLVLNSGSSSLKFQVIDTDLEAIEKNADKSLAQGVIERIGSEASTVKTHVSRVLAKLGVRDRVQAFIDAADKG